MIRPVPCVAVNLCSQEQVCGPRPMDHSLSTFDLNPSTIHYHVTPFFFSFFFFGCATQHAVSMRDLSSPDPGLNLCPLQWKAGVLTTGPPGKSHLVTHFASSPKQTNKYARKHPMTQTSQLLLSP